MEAMNKIFNGSHLKKWLLLAQVLIISQIVSNLTLLKELARGFYFKYRHEVTKFLLTKYDLHELQTIQMDRNFELILEIYTIWATVLVKK